MSKFQSRSSQLAFGEVGEDERTHTLPSRAVLSLSGRLCSARFDKEICGFAQRQGHSVGRRWVDVISRGKAIMELAHPAASKSENQTSSA